MKSIQFLIAFALASFGYYSSTLAQPSFEGTLQTRVMVAGVDMSLVIGAIDYEKGNIPGQIAAAYQKLPEKELTKLQTLMNEDPMMGLVVAMTPPKGTLYVKGKNALVHIKGMGYEIIHAHDEERDEAYIYTASLIHAGEEVTAAYQPSKGYQEVFTDDKRISTDHFDVTRSSETAKVAGLDCNIATYTPKAGGVAPTGLSASMHKLVVYTSKDLPQSINFSHPYYLPEDLGILRIDIYLNDTPEPSLVYEVVSIDQSPVDDSLLMPRKTEPVYALSDSEYSAHMLGIILGGLGAMDTGDDDEYGN